MDKEKICLIFQYKNSANYWFDWFKNRYRNYIYLLKEREKSIHLKNGTVLYFRTSQETIRGLRFDEHIAGEHLESLCLNYENKELHNKIDKAIEYINVVAIATIKPQYFQKIKDTIWGEELLEILKDSDVDE